MLLLLASRVFFAACCFSLGIQGGTGSCSSAQKAWHPLSTTPLRLVRPYGRNRHMTACPRRLPTLAWFVTGHFCFSLRRRVFEKGSTFRLVFRTLNPARRLIPELLTPNAHHQRPSLHVGKRLRVVGICFLSAKKTDTGGTKPSYVTQLVQHDLVSQR